MFNFLCKIFLLPFPWLVEYKEKKRRELRWLKTTFNQSIFSTSKSNNFHEKKPPIKSRRCFYRSKQGKSEIDSRTFVNEIDECERIVPRTGFGFGWPSTTEVLWGTPEDDSWPSWHPRGSRGNGPKLWSFLLEAISQHDVTGGGGQVRVDESPLGVVRQLGGWFVGWCVKGCSNFLGVSMSFW